MQTDSVLELVRKAAFVARCWHVLCEAIDRLAEWRRSAKPTLFKCDGLAGRSVAHLPGRASVNDFPLAGVRSLLVWAGGDWLGRLQRLYQPAQVSRCQTLTSPRCLLARACVRATLIIHWPALTRPSQISLHGELPGWLNRTHDIFTACS